MSTMTTGQKVAYVRVSTTEQNSARQLEEIRNYSEVSRIFEDHISGRSRAERPQLAECIKYIREGDELIVSSIDRLARSLVDLRNLVDEITAKGVTVHFLHEKLTFSKDQNPRDSLMLSVLGAFAEFERAIIRERQTEGIALARKAGKYKGRKRALSPEQVKEARERINSGETKSSVAKHFNVARTTLYRALAEH